MKCLLRLLIVAAAASLAGCMFKHTRANYEKIVPGMTRQQVERIVGGPWYNDDGTAQYWWVDGDFQIKYDQNGQVIDKDWD